MSYAIRENKRKKWVTCKLPCGINWHIFKSRERQCCPQGFVEGGLVACPCLKPGEATLIGSTGVNFPFSLEFLWNEKRSICKTA